MWWSEFKTKKQKEEKRLKSLENELESIHAVLIPLLTNKTKELEKSISTVAKSVEEINEKLEPEKSNSTTGDNEATQGKTDAEEATLDSRVKKLKASNGFSTFVNTVLIVVIIFSGIFLYNMNLTIHELQEKVNVLQEEITTHQEEIDALSVNVSVEANSDAASIFIDSVLPRKDGEWYNEDVEWYDKNSNKFYYDPDCKYTITNPRFCTYDSVWGEDSKGNRIKVYRLTTGDFAYIPSNFFVDLKTVR